MVIAWTQVGQDVVGELTKAMKRKGVDMRVSALVSLSGATEEYYSI